MSLTTTVTMPYNDQAANPFLHTDHPDHDNLNATFNGQQDRGLILIPAALDHPDQGPGDRFFGTRSRRGHTLGQLRGNDNAAGDRQQQPSIPRDGSFVLNRISQVPTLT